MQINNKLVEESFRFKPEKNNMSFRSEEVERLGEINNYCREIGEKILCKDEIWDIEVESGVKLADWIYSRRGSGSQTDRKLVEEIINKQGISSSHGIDINISLGKWENAADNTDVYVDCRREILGHIDTPEEYFEFMHSCFIDSYFADNILSEMKHIKDFAVHAKEITDNLAVLNDEAIELYCEYQNNLAEANDILSSKLLECSVDPKHREALWFPFTYEDVHTDIKCEPHMKLIRRDSDLRIYFYWKDERIADGSKVLIGRIGRHPWKK